MEVTELERVKYLPKFAVDRIVYYSLHLSTCLLALLLAHERNTRAGRYIALGPFGIVSLPATAIVHEA